MGLPTLRQLQYLVAVIELRHFSHAAEKCFVTQSTLSAGIQDLEAQLGISLLERSKRKVLPTPAGIEVAARAQQILTLSSDLVSYAGSASSPLGGQLRLGVIPTIGPFLLTKTLPVIRQTLPDLDLFLFEEQSSTLVEQLIEGSIDIAILAFPYNIHNLQYELCGLENFLVAMPKAHPLATSTTIAPSKLPANELLLLAEGHCLREHALAACRLDAQANRMTLQGTSLYTLVEMVASGLGITLLPKMAVDSHMLNNEEICIRPLQITTGQSATRQIGLVWRPSFQQHALLKQLISIIKNFFIAENGSKI